jgi:hypothetical protein
MFGCFFSLSQRHAFLFFLPLIIFALDCSSDHLTAGVLGHLERQGLGFQHVIDTPFAREMVFFASSPAVQMNCNSFDLVHPILHALNALGSFVGITQALAMSDDDLLKVRVAMGEFLLVLCVRVNFDCPCLESVSPGIKRGLGICFRGFEACALLKKFSRPLPISPLFIPLRQDRVFTKPLSSLIPVIVFQVCRHQLTPRPPPPTPHPPPPLHVHSDDASLY